MKKLKYKLGKFCCLFTAAGLVLSSCSKSPEKYVDAPQEAEAKEEKSSTSENVAMGRYLEEEISLPGDIQYMLVQQFLEDGTLRVAGMTEEGCYFADSPDGGVTWTEPQHSEEWKKLLGESVSAWAISKKGEMFIESKDYSTLQEAEEAGQEISMEDYNTMVTTKYYYIEETGAIQEISPDSALSELNYTSQCQFLEDGSVLMRDNSDYLYQVNPKTGELIRKYACSDFVLSFGAVGNHLIAVTVNTVLYFNLETGEPEEGDSAFIQHIKGNKENFELRSISSSPCLLSAGTEEDSLIFVNHDGIFYYTIGGNMVEQLADGSLNSIGAPGTGLINAMQAEDGSFYLSSTTSEGGPVIYHYVYSKDVATVPNTELTVYSLRDSDFIRQAITQYQKKNPDIYVRFEQGFTGEDGITQSDALKTLNTEIMAGKGPDILLLDEIDYEKYEEKGLLIDLKEWVQKVQDEEGFLENILNAYTKENGSIYEIPLQFGIPLVQGPKEVIDGITDLKSLTEAGKTVRELHPEALNVISGVNVNYLFKTLAPVCSDAWIAEDGSLNKEALTEFFSEFKTLYELDANEHAQEADYYYNFSSFAYWDFGYDSMSMLAGEKYLDIFALYSPQSATMLYSTQKHLHEYDFKTLQAQAEGIFIPVNLVGLNQKGTQQEEAGEFLKFLLSEEGQNSGGASGLSVNSKVYDSPEYWGLDGKYENVTYGSTNNQTGKTVELTLETMTEEQAKVIQDMGRSLVKPAELNSILLEAVEANLEQYVYEDKPLENCISALMQQINLYLSE